MERDVSGCPSDGAAIPPKMLGADSFLGRTREELIALRDSLPPSLSLCEAVRKPRELDDPSLLETTTNLTKSGLRTDLSCPICMGILQHAVVVKDCLHRFCADCIEKCVRIGIRECPQCRIHVASRRSLRPDPLFDRIIRRLFPDVKAFEDRNESLVAQYNKAASRRALLSADGGGNGADNSGSDSDSDSDCPSRGGGGSRSRPSTSSTSCGTTASGTKNAAQLPSLVSLPSARRERLAVYIEEDGELQCRDGLGVTALRCQAPSSACSSSSTVSGGLSNASPTSGGSGAGQGGGGGGEVRLSKAQRKRHRMELQTEINRIPVDGKLHFTFVPDPSIPSLPVLPSAHMAGNGDYTVQQLSRFLCGALKLPASTELRLYSKEHRMPFGPMLTLAYVHQRSMCMSHQSLLVYYTTREFGDDGGGVFRSSEGYALERQPTSDRSANASSASS